MDGISKWMSNLWWWPYGTGVYQCLIVSWFLWFAVLNKLPIHSWFLHESRASKATNSKGRAEAKTLPSKMFIAQYAFWSINSKKISKHHSIFANSYLKTHTRYPLSENYDNLSLAKLTIYTHIYILYMVLDRLRPINPRLSPWNHPCKTYLNVCSAQCWWVNSYRQVGPSSLYLYGIRLAKN